VFFPGKVIRINFARTPGNIKARKYFWARRNKCLNG
jgi:hypothetical protein